MTLVGYILHGFAKAIAAVFLIIFLLVTLFASVDNLRRFEGTDATAGDVLRITLLEAPETLYQVFPLVLMLASLVTFLRLARNSELVVMRAAGISAIRLIGIPVTAAVVLGAIAVAVINPFVAVSLKRGVAVENEFRNAGPSLLSVSSDGLWLRQADAEGQTVIQAARANADGTVLSTVRMHRFDDDLTLYARIIAPAAVLADGAWSMQAATLWELRENGDVVRVQKDAPLRLPTELTSEQILDSFSPPEMIGFWSLGTFIARMEESGFSGLRHRLFLQSELAKPALFAAMVLIGSAFALRPTRFGQTGVMILFAVLAGFSLYFLKDFAETLGAQGQVPLLVAAWTPPIAAILLSLSLLLHLEDG